MHRVAISVALALFLLGCHAGAAGAPPGESVPLLTGALSCYAGGEGGTTAALVADPNYGTSFDGQPVMWPNGYTGRRVGSEVLVVDTHGNVKATTGRSYHISHAYPYELTLNGDGTFSGPGGQGVFPAAAECGYHWDFIDCTADPTDPYCQPQEPQQGPSPTPPQPQR